LARDPANPCCQVPECPDPTPAPQGTPGPTYTTTKAPTPESKFVDQLCP